MFYLLIKSVLLEFDHHHGDEFIKNCVEKYVTRRSLMLIITKEVTEEQMRE
jgi:hypothetical protein